MRSRSLLTPFGWLVVSLIIFAVLIALYIPRFTEWVILHLPAVAVPVGRRA